PDEEHGQPQDAQADHRSALGPDGDGGEIIGGWPSWCNPAPNAARRCHLTTHKASGVYRRRSSFYNAISPLLKRNRRIPQPSGLVSLREAAHTVEETPFGQTFFYLITVFVAAL